MQEPTSSRNARRGKGVWKARLFASAKIAGPEHNGPSCGLEVEFENGPPSGREDLVAKAKAKGLINSNPGDVVVTRWTPEGRFDLVLPDTKFVYSAEQPQFVLSPRGEELLPDTFKLVPWQPGPPPIARKRAGRGARSDEDHDEDEDGEGAGLRKKKAKHPTTYAHIEWLKAGGDTEGVFNGWNVDQISNAMKQRQMNQKNVDRFIRAIRWLHYGMPEGDAYKHGEYTAPASEFKSEKYRMRCGRSAGAPPDERVAQRNKLF
eukprot:tig00000849_g4762.t1